MLSSVSSILALVIGSSSIFLGALFIFKSQVVTEVMENLNQENGLNKAILLSELIAGSVIVYLHNVWVIGYEGLITVIGWYLLVDSAADLLVPQNIKEKMGENMEKNEEEASTVNRGLGFFMVTIGVYLIYSVL